MFVNQFGTQVKADWASFSITQSQLRELIFNVIQRIAHEEQYEFPQDDPLKVGVDNDNESLWVNLDNNDDGILDILEKKGLYNDFESDTARFFIQLMFGETTEYAYADEDSDIVLRMSFEEYIKRVHGF